MQPTENPMCNIVYRGNGDDIVDLPCERRQLGEIHAYYGPSAHDAHLVVPGFVIDLGIYAEPIPPVSVGIVKGPEPEGPIREGAVDRRHLERAVGYLHTIVAERGYAGGDEQLRRDVAQALGITRPGTPMEYELAAPRG